MIHTVYKIMNIKTGKIYIGRTSQTIDVRLNYHFIHARYPSQRGYNGALQKDIRKYGTESFQIEALFENLTFEQAKKIETDTTNDLRDNNFDLYNVKSGDETAESTKEKMREIMSGENNPNYGKTGKKCSISKMIAQYSLDDELIRVFYGSCEANRETGIDRSDISKCCKGKKKTAGGYKWKYYEHKDFLEQFIEQYNDGFEYTDLNNYREA
jgi:group I intron endonuclease